MKNELLKDLTWRGLINDCTDLEALDELLESEMVTLYCGFDPTADSLHVGSLLPILVLKRFQLAKHKPLPLVGGATGLIGDPSGRTTERSLNTLETVQNWSQSIKNQLAQFLNFDENKNGAELVNNYNWTKNLSIIDFLRDYGKHFGINYMLAKDTIAKRLDTGISFTEFTYTILQAMDFEYLFNNKGCKLQIGGSDQWGNITSGLELIRKSNGSDVKAIGLTIPLVTKADGTKFGKTAGGAIWLDAKLTTPYEMYQFFLNTSDDDVIKFLKYFTFLSHEEINQLEEKVKTEPHLREAQKQLAKEVVTLVHGEMAFQQALKITSSLFSGDIKNLTGEEIEAGFKGLPSMVLSSEKGIIDLLIEIKAARSKREAREFVSNNSVSINGEKVNDINFVIKKENAIENKYIVLRRGKKNYFMAKFE
ncbi:tyrosine--tRNA ligase [Mycoplasmatota bacterium]|nr:tyrosine--tRNA ligase [Mycoplasmatota bacterium]